MILGFILGFLCYHFLMNRTVMMRDCCRRHFATHDDCYCVDCIAERDGKRKA